jgi:hypothetical protein
MQLATKQARKTEAVKIAGKQAQIGTKIAEKALVIRETGGPPSVGVGPYGGHLWEGRLRSKTSVKTATTTQ